MISAVVIKMLEKKLKRSIRYSSDVEMLKYDIKKEKGIDIGINTLKRLFGMLDDGCHEPRLYTLDTIARYLGYENWDKLLEHVGDSSYSGFSDLDGINSSSLHADDIVEFTYSPNRHIVLKYVDGGRFIVTMSENSKLLANDYVEADFFIKNFPLIVRKVIRDGIDLGSYQCGKISGLTSIELKKADDKC